MGVKKAMHDYNKRFVYYEKIHQIQRSDFDKISEIASLKDGDRVLDFGGGYGSIIKELIDRNKAIKAHYYLLEPSDLQMSRARYFLESYRSEYIEFIQDVLKPELFTPGFFTHIIAKVALHELPLQDQFSTIREMYNLLSVGGNLYIWTIECNQGTQPFIQEFFRMKDKITKLKEMARERYFASIEEFNGMLDKANFDANKRSFHPIEPMRYATMNQLDGDFKGRLDNINRFNKMVRKKYSYEPLANKQLLKLFDEGNNLTIYFPQYIIQNTK